MWLLLVLVLSFPAYRLTESSRRADAARASSDKAQVSRARSSGA